MGFQAYSMSGKTGTPVPVPRVPLEEPRRSAERRAPARYLLRAKISMFSCLSLASVNDFRPAIVCGSRCRKITYL